MPGRSHLYAGAGLLTLTLLSACSLQDNTADLQTYMAQLAALPAAKIAPLPSLTVNQPIVFAGGDSRNPFSLQTADTTNIVRPKEPLEYFPIESLEFVGTIEQDNERWGLIKATDGEVYKIEIGNYIGPNGGQVKQITENEVVVVEPLHVDGTVGKRQVVMQLKQ